MIVYTTGWHPIELLKKQLSDIAADTLLSFDHAFQDGEVKLHLQSRKFMKDGEVTQSPDNETISYCLQITEIESLELACVLNTALHVSHIEQTPSSITIVGHNGKFEFLGSRVTLALLMDNQSKCTEPAPGGS